MPRAEECWFFSSLEPLSDQGIQPLGGATLSLLSSVCDPTPSLSLENQASRLGPLAQLLLEIPCVLTCPWQWGAHPFTAIIPSSQEPIIGLISHRRLWLPSPHGRKSGQPECTHLRPLCGPHPFQASGPPQALWVQCGPSRPKCLSPECAPCSWPCFGNVRLPTCPEPQWGRRLTHSLSTYWTLKYFPCISSLTPPSD